MKFSFAGRIILPALVAAGFAAAAVAQLDRPESLPGRHAEAGDAGVPLTSAGEETASRGPAFFAQWPPRQQPGRRGGSGVAALPPHSFYFTRAIYSGGGRGWQSMNSWSTDYPKADQQFLTVLRRLANIDAYPMDNAVRLDDPELRRFPFLYTLEVGYMDMTEAEVEGLRGYLLAGGFLMIDDFWGTNQWRNFEREMGRVLPEYPIVDLPMDHPVFSAMYTIDEVIQVPVVSSGISGGPTYERDGIVPHVRGISDEHGRLMVMINWNTDLGDAWEHAEHPLYPLKFSTYAFEIGTNAVIYAMTH